MRYIKAAVRVRAIEVGSSHHETREEAEAAPVLVPDWLGGRGTRARGSSLREPPGD